MCASQALCKSHECYFQKDTTTALYKHFLHQYPLHRGVYGLASISALHPITVVSLVLLGIISGVLTEYLYRKLKPFFASKPALM